MFKINGIVKLVKGEEVISDKFKKREFVLTDASSMYPQDILFQLTQDKTSLVDGVQPNDQIEVSFNIRGREWTSPKGEVKYFNTLEAWRIEKMGSGMPNAGADAASSAPVPDFSNDSSEEDDLPF
ncbi:MAG: DUF3127 domain-containing protein [Crocinitomicaceae bacterium]|jgi:hypothetical protein|nr:DUF3127 domain-containing protein [Crocinitomicaceae bacterium]